MAATAAKGSIWTGGVSHAVGGGEVALGRRAEWTAERARWRGMERGQR